MESKIYDELYHLEKNYWWHVSKRSLIHREIKRAGITDHSNKILDAGCGTGIMIAELSKKFDQVYGLDKSKKAIKFCHKRGLKRSHLRQASLEKKLPFTSNYFDAILALDVIEHLDNDGEAVRQLHRITKNSGSLYVTVPAFQFLWTHHDDLLWHKRRYTLNQLKRLVSANGFTVKKASYFYSFLFLPSVVIFKLGLLFSGKETSVVPPKIVSTLLLTACSLERTLIKFIPLPFGISIFLVAQKNA